MRVLIERCLDDVAQDVTEYTLLIAFVVVISAAMLLYSNASVAGIWTVTNSNLSSAGSFIR